MRRHVLVQGFALLVACRSQDEQKPETKKPPEPARITDGAVDAPAVTSPYVTAEGSPGAVLQAFCRETKPLDEIRELAPGVTAKRLDGEVCEVEATVPAHDALVAVLRRWSQLDEGKVLLDRATMDFTIAPDKTRVSWVPHVPFEQIVGTNGRLLVGLDVARVVGKAPTALKDAVSSPYKIAEGCSKDGCSAYGPRPPGGAKVRIGYLRTGLMASIGTTPELVPRVEELITASLGPGQQEGPNTHHVHVKDGVRYLVRVSPGGSGIDVLISKAP